MPLCLLLLAAPACCPCCADGVIMHCCRKNELEELMLLNLSKKTWTEGLLLQDFEAHASSNDKVRNTHSLVCKGVSSLRQHWASTAWWLSGFSVPD